MKFRKKPIIIKAVHWTGTNLEELRSFIKSKTLTPDFEKSLPLRTLEGTMFASVGDWVIRGIKNEIYPCKPDIFEATYEPCEKQSLTV